MPKSIYFRRAVGVMAICLLAIPASLFGQSTLPQFGHVVLVVEENTNYSSVVGSSSMPYLNSLISKYGLSTNYYADTHPSIGNYFALTTGQILTNNDSETPSAFPVSADNIIRELNAAGKTWKDYAESIPSVGYLGGNSGNYYVRHNPVAYFTDVNCGTSACQVEANKMVPFTQFATDLSAGTLPQFSLVIPNACDDAHNCSLSTADNWLKSNFSGLLSNASFQKDGLLIILFDENSSTGTSCSLTSTNCGGQVADVIVSPLIKSAGYKSSISYDHESTLRLIAQGLGLTTFPGRSSSANNMSDFFGTSSTSNTPVASISPTALSFPSQNIGTASAAQTVSLKNTGTAALSITNVLINGPFTETNNCPSSLAVNTACSVSVVFSPQVTGTSTGTLTFDDNASNSPQTVALSGSGTSSTSGPAASISPLSLSFGSVVVGSASSAQNVTFKNSGSSAMTISGVSASGSFGETNNCPSSLAAGASCTVSVVFKPQTTGTLSGTLAFTDNAPGSPQGVALSGSGTSSTTTGGIAISPTSLSFGTVQVNTTSTKAVSITNGTSSAASFGNAWIGYGFSQTNNCGSSIAAGGSCTVQVTFKPTNTNTLNENLLFSVAGSSHTITLTGTGSTSSTSTSGGSTGGSTGTSGVVSLSPTSLSFGSVKVGSSSPSQAVVLHNGTSTSALVYSVWIGWSYKQTNNCPSTLPAGGSCTINVTFAPLGTGTINENLAVTAGGKGLTTTLTGSGN